jgi:hypothetical protein
MGICDTERTQSGGGSVVSIIGVWDENPTMLGPGTQQVGSAWMHSGEKRNRHQLSTNQLCFS